MGKNITFLGIFFIILFLFSSSVHAVKRETFRNCDQTYFCKTNRNIAKEKASKNDFSTTFSVHSDLKISSEGTEITGLLTDSNPHTNIHQNPLSFSLKSVSQNTFQLLVKEHNNPDRFVQPQGVLIDSVFSNGAKFVEGSSKSENLKVYKLGDNRIEITTNHFKIEVYDGDNELILTGNSRGLLRFEQWRTEEEDLALYDEDDEEDISPKVNESRWTEKFGNHVDNKKHGPTSVSLDWSFSNTEHVFGIPGNFLYCLLLKSGFSGIPYIFYSQNMLMISRLDRPARLTHTDFTTSTSLNMNYEKRWPFMELSL